MRTLTIAIATTATLMAGCSGPTLTTPSSISLRGSETPSRPQPSWMRPGASDEGLLYVTEGTTTIGVYTYPGGELVGQLTGLDLPNLCTDADGDIFVPNYRSQVILEYRHGGTSPVARFKDPGHSPSGCAVNPVNGELAVTEPPSYGSFFGDIVFYRIGHPNPRRRLTDPKMALPTNCAYDGNGNLYLAGLAASQRRYGLLHYGKTFILELHLTPIVTDPGQMQWNGSHLVVSNNAEGKLIEYSIDHHSGTKVGVTTLKGAGGVYWIQGNRVVAPENETTVGIWKYPAGGKPTEQITTGYYPGDVVVSPASP